MCSKCSEPTINRQDLKFTCDRKEWCLLQSRSQTNSTKLLPRPIYTRQLSPASLADPGFSYPSTKEAFKFYSSLCPCHLQINSRPIISNNKLENIPRSATASSYSQISHLKINFIQFITHTGLQPHPLIFRISNLDQQRIWTMKPKTNICMQILPVISVRYEKETPCPQVP